MRKLWLMVTLSLLAVQAWSASFDDQLLGVQQRWAQIQYQLADDDKERAFEALAVDAEALVSANPQRPEAWIWQGIVLSTYAGAKGGLGALSLVKQARASLESALALDETALDGSAHTSLGSLYYQVPGWPLSFGNDEEAKRHLREALRISPDDIDANFFYADFLLDQGEPERARVYLEKALEAPARPNRPLADEGRRHEIQLRLAGLH